MNTEWPEERFQVQDQPRPPGYRKRLLLKTRSMKTSHESGFLADGCERARAATEPQIRADVEREYANRIAAAYIIQRWWLNREMNKQIAERVARIASPDALY